MPKSDLKTLRVDQVGSLLRPEALKRAFAQRFQDEIDDDALSRAQDEAVRGVVKTELAHALPVITDGEYRRYHFMESFGEVAGMEEWKTKLASVIQSLDRPAALASGETKRGADPTLNTRRPVTGKLRLVKNRPLEEFQFAQKLSPAPVKVTLIDTDRICQGYDAEASRATYLTTDDFLSDVVAVEREIVGGLAKAGCRYVQIDGPSYTRYLDKESLEVMQTLGELPSKSLDRAIRSDNLVIATFPDVLFGLHLCRGNRQSMWHREGTYDAIAERLFNGVAHERLLLEYDTDRAGSFEPLRFVPRNKIVVLGLMTTKVGRLETVDELKRRIDEAARYIPLEQLALSPQCGFSSDLRGNQITEDQQWRKLDVMMETAAQVWGHA